MQTWEYAEAKAATGPWTVERVLLHDRRGPVGAAQALVRGFPFGGGGLVWANRAPVRVGATDATHVALLRALREHWVSRENYYLRVAPPVEEEAFDRPGALDEGFAFAGTRGWSAARLDITQTEDALRAGLRQKWRNCLHKAERLGTQVRYGSDSEIFGRFLAAYDRQLRAGDFKKSQTPELLGVLQELLPESRRLVVFEAVERGEPVAWALIARFGDTGEYVASVNSPQSRRLNSGQLLLWHAVVAMKAEGRRWFDLSGMDPHDRESGISHFKAGLGGRPYRLTEELEAHRGGPVPWLIRRQIRGIRRPRASEPETPWYERPSWVEPPRGTRQEADASQGRP